MVCTAIRLMANASVLLAREELNVNKFALNAPILDLIGYGGFCEGHLLITDSRLWGETSGQPTRDDTARCYTICCTWNYITGDCRCPPGWTGPDCATPCPPGRWGSGCGSECECSNGATCDRLTGFCDCPAGFMGKNCETEIKKSSIKSLYSVTLQLTAQYHMSPYSSEL
ncbi:EGF-like domain protein, partial [Ostertagia ostertagi]